MLFSLIRLFFLTMTLVVVLTHIELVDAKEQKPNILIIFTDDQGYADLGCFGSIVHKTPRLDKMAEQGTRYTSFYAQTVCGPSRSALLTGRYPNRSLGWSMPSSEITWASLMQQVGYDTACIGKWDVSNRRAIVDRMPNAKGFGYYFGPLGANDAGKVKYHENNAPAGGSKNMAELTRVYTDKAIDYLKNKRDKSKPFALFLSHTMLHTDIDASPQFKGKSKGGLYGDAVEELDYETGRLLDTLDELNLTKNTLVIYTTDNGPWNQKPYRDKEKGHPKGAKFWGDAGPLRAGKGSCYEAGIRVPCIIRWPGKVEAGKESDAIFATIDFMPTFAKICGFELPEGRKIDGVNQLDLLLGKSKNGARNQFIYMHAKKSANIGGFNKSAQFIGNGIRIGKWKYLRAKQYTSGYAADKQRKEVPELYDLNADIGETKNLAEEHPEKVQELENILKTWWNNN